MYWQGASTPRAASQCAGFLLKGAHTSKGEASLPTYDGNTQDMGIHWDRGFSHSV
jgi:hypothetical protein